MRLENGDKFILAGDSVTDCGRTTPIGESPYDGLGNGYAAFVDAMLKARHPQTPVRILNMGISGNTSRDLRMRWQTDILDLHPDWVSVMVGINDVWRHFDSPLLTESQVELNEYKDNLEWIITQTLPKVKGLVLMTPYFIETNTGDAMRAMMDKYSSIVRELAKQHQTLFIDVQSVFDKFLQHAHAYTLSNDRIHPNCTGHMLIADAVLGIVRT